jgi:molybdopterin-guanine dinucleotide biosynthesis protein A
MMDNHRTIADATAVVLTGGKSSRVAHIVRSLQPHFPEIVVVAASDQELREAERCTDFTAACSTSI